MAHEKFYEMLEHDPQEVKERFKETMENENPSKYCRNQKRIGSAYKTEKKIFII